MLINHLELAMLEKLVTIKTPSPGKGAAGCEMAGRGLTQLLNPFPRPPRGNSPALDSGQIIARILTHPDDASLVDPLFDCVGKRVEYSFFYFFLPLFSACGREGGERSEVGLVNY